MKVIKIALVGASGRMGTEILRIAKGHPDLKITFELDADKRMDEIKAGNVDVVIDFSSPDMTVAVSEWCRKNKKAMVSGTTGLSAKQMKMLEKAALVSPVLWAPNMSVGVSIMNRLLRELGKADGFDFQLEEIHHKHKKDQPSGTAVSLQKTLASAAKRALPAPISIRGGGVPGQHRVLAMGEDEVLSVEHTAFSRAVFARGAIKAALWIAKAPAGKLYEFDDVLGGR